MGGLSAIFSNILRDRKWRAAEFGHVGWGGVECNGGWGVPLLRALGHVEESQQKYVKERRGSPAIIETV